MTDITIASASLKINQDQKIKDLVSEIDAARRGISSLEDKIMRLDHDKSSRIAELTGIGPGAILLVKGHNTETMQVTEVYCDIIYGLRVKKNGEVGKRKTAVFISQKYAGTYEILRPAAG